MQKKYIIALDQGTSSSRAIVFDRSFNVVGEAQREFTQHYPQPGWVEHDPIEIWATQSGVLNEVIARTGIDPREIDSIGITNQRETTIVWDRESGQPIHPAIVWQCRRTADRCLSLVREGYQPIIQAKTGLVIDAYFSATKIEWILDQAEGARERAIRGELCFGTVDSWLIYLFSKRQVHASDMTNASRTMLYNIHTLSWDDELCALFNIPKAMLPTVYPSAHAFTTTNIQGVEIPITSAIGDQQAALFGQRCFYPGQAKNTYGTGCFLLMNTGKTPKQSQHGLVTTIAVGLENEVTYALEGSIFVGGAIVQWLRDEMGLIERSEESETLANSVDDNQGVYCVPAFTGLGAPYWDMYARGTLFGLTRGVNRAHVVRAGLEAIAYQSYDVIKAMEADSGVSLDSLQVDGGASSNQFLMQFQSDLLQTSVCVPSCKETTALGAMMLAGLTTGFYSDLETLKAQQNHYQTYKPQQSPEQIKTYLKGWHKAVERSLKWEEEEIS